MRPVLAFMAWACLVSLACPVQALQEPSPGAEMFYLGAEGRLLLQPQGEVSEPVGHDLYAVGANTALFKHTLARGGSFLPASATIWIEVTQPTSVLAQSSLENQLCALTVYQGVVNGDNYWYYCWGFGVFGTPVILPGIYEAHMDWDSASGLRPVEAEAGDELYTSVWSSFSSSTPDVPTMFVISDADHPSAVSYYGTSEMASTPVELDAGANTTADPMQPESTSGPSSTSPPTSEPPVSTAPSSGDGPTTTTETAASTSPAAPADAQDAPGLPAFGLAFLLTGLALRRRIRR